MELGRREDASTSSVGLAIAAATVAASFIVANLMVGPPSTLDSRSATLGLGASSALEILVREPGRTSTGLDWGVDADNMTRFGLTLDGAPNFIDYVKVKALRNGTLQANATNGAPDYPEVREALGLTDSDLHIRSYPVMPGLDDPRWSKDRNGRLAYFAHYSGASAPVTITQSSAVLADALNVSLTLKNEALTHAIFRAAFSLGDKDTGSTVVTAERHTVLLAPGESQTLWALFPRLQAWDDSIDAVKVDVTDPYGNIAIGTSGTEIGSFWFSEAPPEGGTRKYNPRVNSASMYYVSGDTVTFHVDHYDGDGDHVNNAKARFVLIGPNGNEWRNETVDLPHQPNKVYAYECPNCTTVGNYTAIAWDTSMTWRHVDRVHVSAETMFKEKENIDPVATAEIAILTELATFNPTRYDLLTNSEGDVFGDDSNGPNELVDVLSRYTTLVIGSEVSQTSLNAAETKYAIADWVHAGGNLVVLGTYKQQSRWLEPIYHAAQETANGGISAPDPTHPVLSAPNELEYDRYLDRARAWRIKEVGEFTHVLTRGSAGGDQVDDTLAVSRPGVFNNGTVVLTSYMPGALTEPQDPEEAKRLLHNLMSQGYTMLFLDYGPPIPDGVPVGSASRLVAVPHPNVPGAVVEVRLILYLFG